MPLIAHTIREAQLSKLIDHYLVSTDSVEIQKVCRELGALAPFLRPSVHSSDTATSAAALLHAVHWLEENAGLSFDFIVELMATNPFKTSLDIDGCITGTISGGYDCGVAVHRLWDHHPSRIKMIKDDILVDFYPEVPESRRQDLVPPAYVRSGSIYVTSVDFLKKNQARYGSGNTYAYVLPEDHVVNIDDPLDFVAAESRFES